MASDLIAENKPQVKECLVVCQTSQGLELRGTLTRFTRFVASFELYNPALPLRMSDLLENFRVIAGEETLYSGRALVNNLMNTGTMLVCEAGLEESGFTVTPLSESLRAGNHLKEQFNEFLKSWQSFQRVRPEFKDVMGDLQSFLTELRLWLDRIELEIRSSPSADRQQLERRVIDEVAGSISQSIDVFISRFESIVQDLDAEQHHIHRIYLRRQLHPLLMCSPFAYRTFHKPLGYAGDYEMVDMMMRSPYEGSSLFAKVINVWLLGQAPATAHRNRVEYLARKILEETVRVHSTGRRLRAYDLGCGPAAEIQKFMRESPVSNHAQFTLLDFNEETLAHAQTTLENVRRGNARSTGLQFIKRSVQQLLKETARSVQRSPENQYDLIYCAGLFDYLSSAVCRRLMSVFYEMLAPGGLLVATNVTDVLNESRPFRHSMEYILDWHLIYRNGVEASALAPETAPADACKVLVEDTGVNLFIEVRKPADA